jgi:hypothetical protein
VAAANARHHASQLARHHAVLRTSSAKTTNKSIVTLSAEQKAEQVFSIVFCIESTCLVISERLFCFFRHFFARSEYLHTPSGTQKCLLHLNEPILNFKIHKG